MRKLIVSMNVTLDGYMSGPDCELDWHFQCWNGEMAASSSEQLARVDTILLGRVTYLTMAAYWSSKTAGLSAPREDIDFADMMNSYQKVVFSRTLPAANWCNSRLVKGDIAGEVASLKRQPGKDMIVYGSGRMVSSLMQLGLVDEYRIWMHPVILGKGKPLFKAVPDPLNMTLCRSTIFSSGVTLLCYSVAGVGTLAAGRGDEGPGRYRANFASFHRLPNICGTGMFGKVWNHLRS